MSMLFAAMSLAMNFWEDKANGILPRLSASPGGLSAYVNGKLLHCMMTFLLLGVVLLTVGVFAFDLPVSLLPVMLLWLVFSGVVMWLLMLVFTLLMPSRKSANIVVNAAVLPMAMLGGAFFPAEAMPDLNTTQLVAASDGAVSSAYGADVNAEAVRGRYPHVMNQKLKSFIDSGLFSPNIERVGSQPATEADQPEIVRGFITNTLTELAK